MPTHDGKLGFCVVGCGMIARFHAKALSEIPDCRLTTLVSRSLPAAARMRDDLDVGELTLSTNLEQAVNRADVDVVIVTTPSGIHHQAAIAAAGAGKHVVVEKPLEITVERCDEIIAACQRHNVKLCTIFPSRFHDANRALQSAITAGRFGRLTLGETTCKWWRSQQYYDDGGWKGTQALDGGGALMNQAIHNVDLLLWMMGRATHVSGFTATLAHERIEVEDTAVATIQFASGALGVIQACTSAFPGLPKTIAIHGNQGSVVIEQEDVIRWEFQKEEPQDKFIREKMAQRTGASGGAADPKSISHQGHLRQLADFVDAIRQNRQPLVDGREGRRAVVLIQAIYESMRQGRVITIPE